MKNYIFYLVVLPLIILSRCNSQNRQGIIPKKKAVEFNNNAISLSSRYGSNKDSLEKAIMLLDSAISVDSMYKLAYINKGAILCSLGLYQMMLKVLDKAILLDKENPQLVIIQGWILEKTGHKYEAFLKYQKANGMYDILIEKKPNSIQNKIDKAYLQLFLTNREQAIREYEKIAYSSKDAYIAKTKFLFYSFNRENFIKDFCIPVN